jgi:hypothetical protein
VTVGELPIQQSEAVMKAVVFGLILITLGAVKGDAQLPAPGARVRVSANDLSASPVVGVMTASTSDSIRIALSGRVDTIALATAAIRELEVSTGRRRHTLAGLGYGALGGAVVGATSGYIGFKPCRDTGFLGCYLEPNTRGQATLVGAGIGAVLGMGIGSIVGALTVTERWTIVPSVRVH